MDKNDLKLSRHALDRYIERAFKLCGKTPRNPESSIRKLLRQAQPEEIDPVHRVVRLISSNYESSTYLSCQGWRFVVSDNTVVTIERVKTWEN